MCFLGVVVRRLLESQSALRGCVALATLFVALLPPLGSMAQKRVILSEEKALERVLQKPDSVRQRTVSLGEAEADSLANEIGMPILNHRYVFHEAIEDGRVVRRAVIMNVMGQYQPITFIVGVLPGGTVGRVEIMVYRESRGSEVRRRAFLKQYEKKSINDPLQLHNDVTNITGATISSRGVTNGVRLALLLHGMLESTDKDSETKDG
jgi:thiamine biosynthesis lipoprotein